MINSAKAEVVISEMPVMPCFKQKKSAWKDTTTKQ